MVVSLWVRSGSSRSQLERAMSHYLSEGWVVNRTVGCHVALCNKPVRSVLDLDVRKRIQSMELPPEACVLEVELVSGGRAGVARKIRFGSSSIPCPWSEHPIEVEMPVNPVIWKSAKERRRAPKHEEKIVEEVRSLCGGVDASWAALSVSGRGPSLPELSLPSRPRYVWLSTVFLASTEFDESAVRKVAAGACSERWPSGWFLSKDPVFCATPPSSPAFEDDVWRLLAGWARRSRGRSSGHEH